MSYHTTTIATTGRIRKAADRGVALVTTLILLALLGAASIGIALLVSSDTMINGYYRSFRGSFYAADSGVNVVSEVIKNSIYSAANLTSNDPLTGGAVPTSVGAAYAPFLANYTTIGDAGSWNSQFKLVSATVSPAQTLGGAALFCNADTPAHLAANVNVQCDYLYPFDVTVKGISSGNENEQIEEKGMIHFSSFSGSPGNAGLPSFAKWGAFITTFPACDPRNPSGLVPGTMNGPFFTDTQWNFGNYSNPGYTFNGTVGQVAAQPEWVGGNPSCQAASAAPRGFTSPKYNGGPLQTSQSLVQPPSDSYSQAQAVLDGVGAETTAAAFQTAASTELKTVGGTSYPASGSVPNGVYIPSYTDPITGQQKYGTTTGVGAAGGFYVQGDASITLSATKDGSNNPTQTYTIKQTSGFTTTTTTIVVDIAKNTTTVTQGATNQTLTGVPSQPGVTSTDPSGNAVNPTMLYVNGNVTGLSGTVQDDTGITIAAADNVQITGNLTYKSQPVSTPADTLNSGTDAGVLGIYTTGNINLNPSSGSSLTTDASLAALSGKTDGTGTSGFCTSGSISSCSANQSNITWTIVGGRAEDQAHSVNISSSNTYYDQRFASGAFGPPWFPTAQPQPGSPTVPSSSGVTVSRTSWAELNR